MDISAITVADKIEKIEIFLSTNAINGENQVVVEWEKFFITVSERSQVLKVISNYLRVEPYRIPGSHLGDYGFTVYL